MTAGIRGRALPLVALAVVAAAALAALTLVARGPSPSPGASPPAGEQPPPATTAPGDATASPASSPIGTVWLAPSGTDTASGGPDDPLRTPAAAAARGATEARLAAGTYPGFELTTSMDLVGPPDGWAAFDGRIEVRGVTGVRLERLEIVGRTGAYEPGLLVESSEDVQLADLSVHDNTFGIQLRDVRRVTVEGSSIEGNGSGIEIHGMAHDVLVRGNRLVGNDRAVDGSRGANGINLFRVVGPVTIADNEFRANYNPNPEPGTDVGGGAIELYATSDVLVTGNLMVDNSVLETGTEDGIPCARLTFVRNLMIRGSAPTRQDGLVLRCASDSLVAHNTFDGLDDFAIDIVHEAGAFAGSVDGLRVLNNVIVNGRAYSIDNELPASVVIDRNLVHNPGSRARQGEWVAYHHAHGNTASTDELRTWGLDATGIDAPPRFVAPQRGDYRLMTGSPAIDAGIAIPGVNDDVPDGRPDLGRWEHP